MKTLYVLAIILPSACFNTAFAAEPTAMKAFKSASFESSMILQTTKADQRITFNAIPYKIYGAVDFDPGASSNSGLQVTYKSSNQAVATIIGNKIHIVGVGTSNITASQSGNANFNAAPNVIRPLHVQKSGQKITFNAIPVKPYGTADFAPGATSNSGLPVSYTSSNPNVATIVNGKIHVVGVGTSNIIASQGGNNNYHPATSILRLLNVSKVGQTIAFSAIPAKIQGTADFIPGATSTSKLAVTYSSSKSTVATIVNGKIHIVGPGSSTITASQAGNQFYNAAANVSQTLNVIAKTNQTITFAAIPVKPFGTADFLPGAKSTSGLGIVYLSSNPKVATIVAGKIHLVGVGVSTISATQPGNGTFNPATKVSQNLTISKGDQKISFATVYSKPFASPDFALTASSSSGLPVTFTSSNPKVATIIGGKVHIVAVGTTNITASQNGNANYNAAPSVTKSFIVNQANQSITYFPAIANKTLKSPDFVPPATASSGLQVIFSVSNPKVATILNGKIHITGVGTTIVTASQPGNQNYRPAASLTKNLTVVNGGRVAGDGEDSVLVYVDEKAILLKSLEEEEISNSNEFVLNGIGRAKEELSKPDFKIFPNPASSEINIEQEHGNFSDNAFGKSNIVSIRLHNDRGVIVREIGGENNQKEPLSMKTTDLPDGVYILQIIENKSMVSRKILIKH